MARRIISDEDLEKYLLQNGEYNASANQAFPTPRTPQQIEQEASTITPEDQDLQESLQAKLPPIPDELPMDMTEAAKRPIRNLTSEDEVPVTRRIPGYMSPETGVKTDELLTAEENRLGMNPIPPPAPTDPDILSKRDRSLETPLPDEIPVDVPLEQAKAVTTGPEVDIAATDHVNNELKATDTAKTDQAALEAKVQETDPVAYMRKKMQASEDELKTAQSRANLDRQFTGIGDALSQAAYDFKNVRRPESDIQHYERAKKEANIPVEQVGERQKFAESNLNAVDKVFDMSTKSFDFERKKRLGDANSPESKAVSKLMSAFLPEDMQYLKTDPDFQKLSALDQKEFIEKALEKRMQLDTTKAAREQTAAYNNARLELQKQKASQPVLNPFQKAAQQQEAKKYADVQSAATQADEQMTLVDDAIKTFTDYTQTSRGGTGPLATLGGLTQYVSEPTQNLQAKFKLINVKNMAKTFQGMSRAIDSNTERRAWESTQASITNDDAVNANILLGTKALAIKAKAEAEAQKQYANEFGNLDKYESPILGKTSIAVNPRGDMELVPKEKYAELLKSGYRSLDAYAEQEILKHKGSKRVPAASKKQVETKPSASEIKMKNPKTGQITVFDQNKQFLRYE